MKFSNLTRVYITSRIILNQTIAITDDLFHYCKSVLRMRANEEFRLFNKIDGEFLVKILVINKRDIQVFVVSHLRIVPSVKPLIIALCIIKPDRFIEAVKGAASMGATEIIPVISEYTQIKSVNYDRVNKCIIEATEQSERMTPAVLRNIVSLDSFCQMPEIEQIIFANENENEEAKISSIQEFKNNLALLIGPEGGFSAAEKTELISNPKVFSISLGNAVFRSEVATIAMIACVDLMRG